MIGQFSEISKVMTKNGDAELSQILSEPNLKYVGIFFSASWCKPCMEFTPVLS